MHNEKARPVADKQTHRRDAACCVRRCAVATRPLRIPHGREASVDNCDRLRSHALPNH